MSEPVVTVDLFDLIGMTVFAVLFGVLGIMYAWEKWRGRD